MATLRHDLFPVLLPKPRPLSDDGLRNPRTMSDDNVNQETLPFRARDASQPATMPEADQSLTSVDPDFAPDSPRKSNRPLVSDDGSPMGSSITNRAYPSGSYTFSHHRPGSAGALPHDSYTSDALSEQGAAVDFPSPNPSKGHRPLWRGGRAAPSASPDRPMSRTAAENRLGKSAVGDSDARLSRTSLSPFPVDPAAEDAPGPSQLPPAMIRSSLVSTDGAGTPPPPPSAGPAEGDRAGALPPRRSRQSRENLSYGQESARGLSNEQKAAGGISAVAGEEQLINEVRGIYAGLVMVEKKCIEIDKQQSESKAPLDNQKWQALIALHRTLLQEHHDFFMASQHPSASPVLRRLAEKYAMPARMWRYGIHSFLELLRHRLPESLDHMLTFIYLAYSMMTLLLETVSGFQETWIECLGDLSRYRMAVEESDLKEREVWAGVARYWYNKAADRNPDVGRIQHHLAVLSRPYILQQLFYYTKSLVSVRAFAGTRESILLLFNPILHSPTTSSHHVRITAFVSAHGSLFSRDTSERFTSSVAEFLTPLDRFITRVGPAFRMQGVQIASSNFAAMLEYGHPDAMLPEEFQSRIPQSQAPSAPEDIYQSAAAGWASTQDAEKVMKDFRALGESQSSRFLFYGAHLTFDTLSIFLDQIGDQNIYPALHISLAFLWSLSRTSSGMKYAEAIMPWQKLVPCLNAMIRPGLDVTSIGDSAFPEFTDTKWLPEDFYIRGQLWSQSYYPPHFFEGSPSEDEGRNIEPPVTASRMYRCLWLGVRLAQFNRWITYDSDTRTFAATPFAQELARLAAQSPSPFTIAEKKQEGPRSDVQMQGS